MVFGRSRLQRLPLPALLFRAMADIMEASPSNTCGPVTIRREEYLNQFRVAFLDE